MAEKKASLTVLGGPLAGTRFVLEDVGPEVLLGSDPACGFRLDLTGVSAHHARLKSSAGGFTIEDAGSAHGLHVNDSKVSEATALRNGDIVWLGTPGEADVVMLQCILPARPAAAPPPPEPPAPAIDEDETLALALEQSEGAAVKAETLEEAAATGFYTADDAAAASVPFVASAPTAEPELVVAEDEPTVHAESVPFAVDAPPPPPPAPAPFEDDTKEQTFVFEEESATVVMASSEPVEAASVYHEETGIVSEEQATVAMPPAFEPTVALPTPPPPAPAPAKPKAQAKPAPPPPAPAPAPAPRPARPTPAAAAPRKPAPRPQPPPRMDDDEPPSAAKGTSSTGLYIALGFAGLAVVAGGVYAVRKFMGASPAPTLAQAPSTTAVAAPPHTPPPKPVAETPVPVVETPVETQPTPVPVPTPVVVAPPPTTLKGVPTPAPTPTPAAKKAPTPPPVTTPAGPSPEQVRAQQVASLLGQADSAMAAGQYDQAILHLDEVLRLDPGNGKASADRVSAVSMRETSKRKFVAGRTVVKTEKASGGISGFEGADVQRTPDFSGRIEFEMSPASGLRPGDAWTLKIYLVNDGKKVIKIGGVTANTVVNGSGSGGPVTPGTKEVAPQQRALLGQATGSWKDGTTSWLADVLVTANKGDSLKNALTWR